MKMSKKSKTLQKAEEEKVEAKERSEVLQNEPANADSDGSASPDLSKKRKRELNEENLEVDLGLPEPPSKKALRKAKKLQKAGKHEEAKKVLENDNPARDAENDPVGDVAETEEPVKEPKAPKPKATHSIWIGNLPFSATKSMLTDFLVNNSQPPIAKESITRVNVPAPANAKATKTTIKPMNKGFAYVDFSDEQAFMAAVALSETVLGGRNLLIKNAKSFEGRPTEHQTKQQSGTNKVVSRRVFVGNLGFDVTIEDLERLFAKCGSIEHVHMATFEDTGKCKGFAWVTFITEDAASAAVKGVVIEEMAPDEDDDDEEEKPSDEQAKRQKKPKKRQWWCNRLNGREVRREFAEDSTVRYNKRFGKGKKDHEVSAEPIEETQAGAEVVAERPAPKHDRKHPFGLNPGATSDHSQRRGRSERDPARERKAQEEAERVRYRTGQVAQSQGTKVTFE